MTYHLNTAFANHVFIEHPEFGVGIIRRIDAIAPKMAWINFDDFKNALIPCEFKRDSWANPKWNNDTETIIEVNIAGSKLVSYGKEHSTIIVGKFQSKIDNGTEYELYAGIKSLYKMRYHIKDSKINTKSDREAVMKKFDDVEKDIAYAFTRTARFGTGITVPIEGQRVFITDNFYLWYDWWNSYINNEITTDAFATLEHAVLNNLDHSSYRPKGSWRSM